MLRSAPIVELVPMQSWRIRLFGTFRVEGDSLTVDKFETKRSAQLLARLAVSRNPKMLRADLADLLWPEDYFDATRVRLRQELSRLRRALGEADPVVLADPEFVALDQSAVEVDLSVFESEVRAARIAEDDEVKATKLERALKLADGEFLIGWDDDWVVAERNRLRALLLELVLSLAELRHASGQNQEALELAQRGLEIDPLNEQAHMAAIAAYGAIGSLTDALGQYQQMKRVLREQLDRCPSAEAEELVTRIKSGTPPVRGAPARTMTVGCSLPTPVDRFFGREQELDQIANLLAPGSPTRLVTLTGTGGIGKTRLALEAALANRPSFSGGVHFVPLTGVSDPSALAGAVIESLGQHNIAQSDPVVFACRVIPQSDFLLVLDNLEQLLPEAATTVQRLLEGAPKLKIVVTSRVPLRVSAERTVAVGPLPTGPDSPAMSLLTDQALAVRPGFTLSEESAKTVVGIVDRLEGIPLAIRIAASRLRLLTPSQLEAQLGDRFTTLENQSLDAPERHKTLRAALQWSFDYLPDPARDMLRAMSAYRSGWSLDMASRATGDPKSLETMELLCDHSLVTIEDSGDSIRFDMLQTVRDFAESTLEAHELKEIQASHLRVVSSLLLDLVPHPSAGTTLSSVESVELELENIRAAIRTGLDSDPVAALGIAVRMARHWRVRGHVSEGIQTLTDVLGRVSLEQSPEVADAKLALAILLQAMANNEGALPWFQAAREDFERQGRRDQAAIALSREGLVYRTRGDFDQAVDFLDRATVLALESHDDIAIARAFINKGHALYYSTRIQEAMECMRTAKAHFDPEADPYFTLSFTHIEAWIHHELDQISEAMKLLESVIGLPERLGDLLEVGAGCELRGRIALKRGEYEDAKSLFSESMRCWSIVDSLFQVCDQRCSLSRALIGLGEIAEARSQAKSAFVGWSSLSDQGAMQVAIHSLVAVLVAEGRYEDAARLLGHCTTRQSEFGSVFVQSECSYVDQIRYKIVAKLGAKPFGVLMDSGAKLPMDEAEGLVASLFAD